MALTATGAVLGCAAGLGAAALAPFGLVNSTKNEAGVRLSAESAWSSARICGQSVAQRVPAPAGRVGMPRNMRRCMKLPRGRVERKRLDLFRRRGTARAPPTLPCRMSCC